MLMVVQARLPVGENFLVEGAYAAVPALVRVITLVVVLQPPPTLTQPWPVCFRVSTGSLPVIW